MDVLAKALSSRQADFRNAIDRLRELSPSANENEVYELTSQLREAIELVGCARRLLAGRTVNEVHAAFGAPGDFGYDTPIGDALAALYRGGR